MTRGREHHGNGLHGHLHIHMVHGTFGKAQGGFDFAAKTPTHLGSESHVLTHRTSTQTHHIRQLGLGKISLLKNGPKVGETDIGELLVVGVQIHAKNISAPKQ